MAEMEYSGFSRRSDARLWDTRTGRRTCSFSADGLDPFTEHAFSILSALSSHRHPARYMRTTLSLTFLKISRKFNKSTSALPLRYHELISNAASALAYCRLATVSCNGASYHSYSTLVASPLTAGQVLPVPATLQFTYYCLFHLEVSG